MRKIITVTDRSIIELGFVGDDRSTVVRFPISTIISRYGAGGTFELLSKPPEADAAHKVDDITQDGLFVEWTVGIEELTKFGKGQAQLVYTDGEGKAHRKIWETVISRSLIKSSN